jgi:hypothetical protein
VVAFASKKQPGNPKIMPPERRRRTERLFLRYPVRVQGIDSSGRRFTENTHSIVVNRHGGRVLIKAHLTPDQTLTITHEISGRSAEFRVVGLAGDATAKGGEWGVECRDEGVNFWGITFPPLDETSASSSVLLECSQCQQVALTPISMVEFDILDSRGSLSKRCDRCRTETSWVYSIVPLGSAAQGTEEAPSKEAQASSPEPAVPETAIPAVEAPPPVPSPTVAERRASQRVALRLPIRVRNAKDVSDLTKSENVSKGGLAFTSDKLFEVDEIIRVTCPYNPAGDNIEVPGRVVRREPVAGTERFLYGVEYRK